MFRLFTISLVLHLGMARAEAATLGGYVFRETDGNPPRRAMTLELVEGDRTRYRETTGAGGRFEFLKVKEGRYSIRIRFGDSIVAEDPVTVSGTGRNFAAVMLPKRRARAQDLRAVSASQLAAQSNRTLGNMFRKAARLVARHDLAGAAALYEQASAAGPTADLWDALGLLYLQMGKNGESIRAFEKAIELNPEYLFPYAHLGWLYREDRRYAELLALARRALAADPQWMTALALLGEAQAGTGDSEAALQSLQRASDIVQGKAAGPHLAMAKVRYLRQDCDGARRELDRHLELNTSALELPGTVKLLQLLKECRPRASGDAPGETIRRGQ